MDKKSLEGINKQFKYYKQLGDRTFEQVSDEDLFWKPNQESNSIAIIVNHLSGNMKSRWTKFLTTNGEKSWRNRDLEFENKFSTRDQMLEAWEDGWNCLFNALNSINESNVDSKITIRNQVHSISEAIHRQMMHYSYHIGQIVYIGRMRSSKDWSSLSIPKGESENYNQTKRALGIHAGHFTDNLRNE